MYLETKNNLDAAPTWAQIFVLIAETTWIYLDIARVYHTMGGGFWPEHLPLAYSPLFHMFKHTPVTPLLENFQHKKQKMLVSFLSKI